MLKSVINIVADDREHGSELYQILSKHSDIKIKTHRLPTGDYLIENRILIERKTIPDFAASVSDGRLFEQTKRLKGVPYRAVLLLEGSMREFEQMHMSIEAVRGTLVNLAIKFAIPVLRSRDAQESANQIITAARQLKRSASGGLPRAGKKAKDKKSLQIYVLKGLPGLGPILARRMIDRFGDLETIFTAPSDELQKIKGIGYNKAKKLRWIIKEPEQLYTIYSC